MKIPSPYALYNIRYHWGLVKLLYIYITHSYYMRCRSVLSKIKRGPIALPCLANFYYIHINNYIYTDPINISSIHIALPCLGPFRQAPQGAGGGQASRQSGGLRDGRAMFFSMGKWCDVGYNVCVCVYVYIYIYMYIYTPIYTMIRVLLYIPL